MKGYRLPYRIQIIFNDGPHAGEAATRPLQLTWVCAHRLHAVSHKTAGRQYHFILKYECPPGFIWAASSRLTGHGLGIGGPPFHWSARSTWSAAVRDSVCKAASKRPPPALGRRLQVRQRLGG